MWLNPNYFSGEWWLKINWHPVLHDTYYPVLFSFKNENSNNWPVHDKDSKSWSCVMVSAHLSETACAQPSMAMRNHWLYYTQHKKITVASMRYCNGHSLSNFRKFPSSSAKITMMQFSNERCTWQLNCHSKMIRDFQILSVKNVRTWTNMPAMWKWAMCKKYQ